MIWIDVPDHKAEPVERMAGGALLCQVCLGAVRTWDNGQHPIHAEPRPQRMEVPCDHRHVEQDDDGQARRFSVCTDCHQEVVLSEPDEDGESFWEEVN